MSSSDNDEKERLEAQRALDAEHLAQQKAALEAAETEEERKRIAAGRLAAAQAAEASRQQANAAQQQMRQKLEAKHHAETREQETMRRQEHSLQPKLKVAFSPEPLRPHPPKPGEKPAPEPAHIQAFRKKLSEIDPTLNNSVIYDAETNRLTFSGPRGLEALKKYLDDHPTARFEGFFSSKAQLKEELLKMKKMGISLESVAEATIGGERLSDDELKEIKKGISNPKWPPRPTPPTTPPGTDTTRS